MLKAENRADPRVKVLNMSRRFGVFECMLAGMGYAAGDAVITMDSDLQDPPELIPQLIEKWRGGADVAYTVRLSRSGESAARLFVTTVAYRLIRRVSEVPLPIDAGDYKLMSRAVVDRILAMDEAQPYLRGLVAWVGFRQEPVYYDRERRFAGRAQFRTWWTGGPARLLFAGIAFYSALPMMLFVSLGLVALLIGVLAAPTLALLALTGVRFSEWLWLMAPLLALSGLQLFAVGIIGLYVNTVLQQVRHRPRYVIESTVGLEEPALAHERS